MTRARLLWLLPLRAAGIGVLVGALVVGAVLLAIRLAPPDPASFRDLGYAVGGVVLGVVVAVAVWLGGLVRAAIRLFERPRRLGVLLAAVAAVFVLAVIAGLVGGQLEGAGLPQWAGVVLTGVAVVALVGAPSLAFVAWDRRLGTPAR